MLHGPFLGIGLRSYFLFAPIGNLDGGVDYEERSARGFGLGFALAVVLPSSCPREEGPPSGGRGRGGTEDAAVLVMPPRSPGAAVDSAELIAQADSAVGCLFDAVGAAVVLLRAAVGGCCDF